MRAHEFINEGRGKRGGSPRGAAKPKNVRGGTNPGKPRREYEFPMQGVAKSRDIGGYDRIYHMNRMGMAMAMADGESTTPVNMNQSSWSEKFNTHHPYTKEEALKIAAAINTVPTEYHQVSDWSESQEVQDTYTKSPVTGFSGYGKKGRK